MQLWTVSNPYLKGELKMKPDFLYDDLRGWLDQARKLDEVRDVEGATWQEEIGMASEVLQHTDPAPAALFDKIPGYPEGYRVLVNFFGGQRKNMTLGFPAELSRLELSNEVHHALQTEKPIPYQVVKSGPVLENVQMGDNVNVLCFPAPDGTELDGRRCT